MSIRNDLEYKSDAGFLRSCDLRSARRQLYVSLFLVIVTAGAAITLGLMTRFDVANSTAHPAIVRGAGSISAET